MNEAVEMKPIPLTKEPMPQKKRRRKKKSSFDAALLSAEKRLGQATAERAEAQDKLAALNAEIPSLQRTIQALKQQLGEPLPTSVTLVGGAVTEMTVTNTGTGYVAPPVDRSIPPELERWITPLSLEGFGSIPAPAQNPSLPMVAFPEDSNNSPKNHTESGNGKTKDLPPGSQ